MSASARPRLRLISLGGTISMQSDGRGLQPALNAEQIAAAAPRLAAIADVGAVSLQRIPSAHLTLADVMQVGRQIRDARAEGCDAVVVTVGTDTLEEIAYALDLLTSGSPAVAVTGAMRSTEESGADGVRNLESAAIAALSPAGREACVLAVFADEIHDPAHVQKMSAVRTAAFACPGRGPLGRIIEGEVVMYASRRRPPLHFPTIEFAPARTPILTCALGSSELLPALDAHVLDGLVVSAFGGGHVPPDWIEPLTRLAEHVPVVIASRVPEGPALRRTYAFAGSEIDLAERGFLSAGALAPLKARLLLSFAIGAGCGRDETARLFAAAQSG